MAEPQQNQAAVNASSCHVEQKYFCFVGLLSAWMAGRSPERVAAELHCTPPTVRNWLGTSLKPSLPTRPARLHLAQVLGCTDDELDRAIAETERRRAAAAAGAPT